MASVHGEELFYHRLAAPSLLPAEQYRPSEPVTSWQQGDSKGIQDLLPGLEEFYQLQRDRHYRLAPNSTPEVLGSIIHRESDLAATTDRILMVFVCKSICHCKPQGAWRCSVCTAVPFWLRATPGVRPPTQGGSLIPAPQSSLESSRGNNSDR